MEKASIPPLGGNMPIRKLVTWNLEIQKILRFKFLNMYDSF